MKKFLNQNLKSFVNNQFYRVKDDTDYEHPFFLIEIMERRKDNPDLDCPYRTIRWFTVYSIEEFDKLISIDSEMIDYCNKHNARAYLHVNIKDSRATMTNMLHLMSKYSNFNCNQLYKLPECFFTAARMQEANIKEKNMWWVIDFDYKDGIFSDEDSSILDEKVELSASGAFYEDGFIANVRKHFIDFACKNYSEDRKKTMNYECFSVKTVNGFHLIIPPFDLTSDIRSGMIPYLKEKEPKFIDIIKEEVRLTDRIKKNNSTILYMP